MNIVHLEDEPWDSGIANYALTMAAEQARRAEIRSHRAGGLPQHACADHSHGLPLHRSRRAQHRRNRSGRAVGRAQNRIRQVRRHAEDRRAFRQKAVFLSLRMASNCDRPE